MSDEKQKQESDWGWIVPVLITLVWFGLLAWYLNLPYEKGGEKLYWIDKIAALDPSNFGDFLSGAFAPVAFLWLAYSVWIQKQELSLTRKVMIDQEEALRTSSISNAALAEETKKQNEIEAKKNSIDYFKLLIENYYDICVKLNNIQLNDRAINNYGFQLAYVKNNQDTCAYTGFKLSENITGSRNYIISQRVKIIQNENYESFRGFYNIVEEIRSFSDTSSVSKAIFLAHGLDRVIEALQLLDLALDND